MTPRTAKAKGTAWESAVAAYLRAQGLSGVERRALMGARDRGDLAGLRDWTVEAKALRTLDLASAVSEAMTEASHTGTRWYCAVLKRRGRGVSEGYVVMPLSIFANIVAQLERISVDPPDPGVSV